MEIACNLLHAENFFSVFNSPLCIGNCDNASYGQKIHSLEASIGIGSRKKARKRVPKKKAYTALSMIVLGCM